VMMMERETNEGGDGTLAKGGSSLATEELDVLRGMMSDLRQENAALLSANQAIRAEIVAIRRDMMNMNEVIKNVLSIYDVVCKDINPFLDDGSLTLIEVEEDKGAKGPE